MNERQLNELLELKARPTPAAEDYPSTEEFIAGFRRRRQRRHRHALLCLGGGIAAAGMMLLLTQTWLRSPDRNAAPATPLARTDACYAAVDCLAEVDRLAEAERHFGKNIGVMFVNDDLLVYERQQNGTARYRVTIRLFSADGEILASLEFASPGDDYIILEDEAITGRIFLNRCDDQDTVVELDLRMQDTRQQPITVNKIMAIEQRRLIQNLRNGTRLRVDFSPRNS